MEGLTANCVVAGAGHVVPQDERIVCRQRLARRCRGLAGQLGCGELFSSCRCVIKGRPDCAPRTLWSFTVAEDCREEGRDGVAGRLIFRAVA